MRKNENNLLWVHKPFRDFRPVVPSAGKDNELAIKGGGGEKEGVSGWVHGNF
jgi:hypothetical protein